MLCKLRDDLGERKQNVMNDPHVELLCYRVAANATVSYNKPETVEWETGIFNAELSEGTLLCRMKEHFPSIESARHAVEQLLDAWKIATALEMRAIEIEFVFEDGQVIDRNPPPPGSTLSIRLASIVSQSTVGTPTLHITRNAYPKPPARFRLTPDIETMWTRYQNYKADKEPLLSMAYFCLTIVEASANSGGGGGGRKKAATKYSIEYTILDKLGVLTSTKGDEVTARKAVGTSKPLSSREVAWIDAAIRAIILQIGQYEPNKPIALLKMQDLPSI